MKGINPNQYEFDEGKALEVIEKYPDLIVGLKLLVGTFNCGNGKDALKPLEKAIAFRDRVNPRLRICAHATGCPVPIGELSEFLQPGDIVAHCFQGDGNTILDAQGHIDERAITARKHGVIFDAAPGKGNFSFSVARAAIEQGFYPDLIGTDITQPTNNKPLFCKNLPFIMSKFLAIGMPLEEIIRCCTVNASIFLEMRVVYKLAKRQAFLFLKCRNATLSFVISTGQKYMEL